MTKLVPIPLHVYPGPNEPSDGPVPTVTLDELENVAREYFARRFGQIGDFTRADTTETGLYGFLEVPDFVARNVRLQGTYEWRIRISEGPLVIASYDSIDEWAQTQEPE